MTKATAPPGHACRTDAERVVCAEMNRQSVPHAHRSLHFRVARPDGREARYAPAVVAHRGSILFLVEPVASEKSSATVERLTRFLEQHSSEIVLAVVTADGSVDRIPPEAYDEVYALSQVRRLVTRIRGQDPEEIVPPFKKPPR